MHGNVWEWCEDLWLDTIYKDYKRPGYNLPCGTAVDPVNTDRPQTSTNDFHAIRGGSWYNGDLPCRSSNRSYWDREDAACYIGFRLARDAHAEAHPAARADYEAEQAAINRIESAGGTLYSSRGIDIEVRFEGDNFDEAALPSLQLLPDLRRLVIAWRTRDAVLSQTGLNEIAKLSKLQTLDFAGSLEPKKVDLSVLTRLPDLQILKFPRTAPLVDDQLTALQDFTSLTEFQCFGTEGGLTDRGIAALSGNRSLESLHVFENQATGGFLADFIGCPLRSFQSTAIYNADGLMTDASAKHLATFDQLETLRLERFPQVGRATMQAIGKLHALRQVSLEECSGLADEDYHDLQNLSRLDELNLINSNAADAAATAIASIPRIRKVRIDSDQLTDNAVSEIATVFSIQELRLMSPLISDEGLRSIGRVNRLREFTIGSDQITGTGLGPICNLPELRDLSPYIASADGCCFRSLVAGQELTEAATCASWTPAACSTHGRWDDENEQSHMVAGIVVASQRHGHDRS